MALFQALVIGLLALIITPGYLFYFDVIPKIVVLLAGAGLALAIGGPVPRGRGRAWQLFTLLLALNVVSLAASTAFSVNPALSAFGTNWRHFGSVIQAAILLFAWLVASHASGRPERVRTILRSITLSGGISAVYGIAQYFGWDPILPQAAYHIGEGIWAIVRPPGTLGYVSYFATWLLFVALLSPALAATESSSWWRRLAWISAGLSTVAMWMTGTRAAILGLVAGVAVGLWKGRASKPEPQAKGSAFFNLRFVAVAALILAAGVGFYFSPFGWKLRSRTRWFVEDPYGGGRATLWRDSLRMAAHKLPLGYGPEVFTAAFARFKSKALAEAYPDFLHESPHNIFLDALVSQGLVGFLILCGLCYVGLRAPPDTRLRWIPAALAAGIVSQLFTVFTVPTALIFFVTIALNVAVVSEPVDDQQPLPYRLAVAPVSLALLYLAARFTLSDHTLALARHDVEQGNLPSAMAYYERYRRWNLPGTTSDLWYSRALLGLAKESPNIQTRYQAVAQSGVAAVRATSGAEDPFNAWYSLASLYASQNDAQGTERCLLGAITASPNWFKPHWALARLLRLEGRLDESAREAALAAELDGGKHAEVSQTLTEIRAQIGPATTPEHK